MLDGTGSYDPEGDTLSHRWTQTAGPKVHLSDASAREPAFLAPAGAAGQALTFSLKVTDSAKTPLTSLADSVTVKITEADNPPTVKILPAPVKVGTNYNLYSEVRDPDGDALKFRWQQVDGPKLTLNKADGPILSFTPPAGTGLLEPRLSLTTTDVATGPKSAKDVQTIRISKNGGKIDCAMAIPSQASLWPPRRNMIAIGIGGIVSSKPYGVTITGVTQDEPVKKSTAGDNTGPDAVIIEGAASPRAVDSVLLRAERQTTATSGNGRVYEIRFLADDGGDSCEGAVKVEVPAMRGAAAVDNGQNFDSTQ
jgi:hypothetical protein